MQCVLFRKFWKYKKTYHARKVNWKCFCVTLSRKNLFKLRDDSFTIAALWLESKLWCIGIKFYRNVNGNRYNLFTRSRLLRMACDGFYRVNNFNYVHRWLLGWTGFQCLDNLPFTFFAVWNVVLESLDRILKKIVLNVLSLWLLFEQFNFFLFLLK